ncbi:MAG: hypothetical protein QME32_00865 [Endomicrobiia bacterium]|nr:hypothetical protein [Endomicrobiia bacterium]
MESKNAEFISKYYGDALVRGLISKQAQRYGHAIGWGKVLSERGWTLPVKEVPPERIGELLDDKLDIFFPIRVKDDSELVIIWDIEYFNNTEPGWLFDRKNQKTVFSWMAPAFLMVEDILKSYGIKYAIDVTMSGIHVWSKVRAGSAGFNALADEGTLLASLEEKYAEVVPSDLKRLKPVAPELGRAYNAAGKILEFFTHELIRRNRKENPTAIPVTISDTPQFGERYPYSGISSDLTQYGHPIFMRCIRAFCSAHQKSIFRGFEELGPAVDVIKTGGITYSDAARIMWDADEAIKFYRDNFAASSIDIPDSSDGWLAAAKAYSKSELKDKHMEWETAEPYDYVSEDKRGLYYNFFDRRQANPALLTPVNLQTLGEEFGNDGATEAKKIFRDIANCYADDTLGWYDPVKFTGIDWKKYDPQMAADFWGRVYWSLHKMGLGRGSGHSQERKK